MNWETCHIWMLIGICISVLSVNSFDFENIRTRNITNLEDLPVFEKAEVPIFSIIDRLPQFEISKPNKSHKNDTAQSLHNEVKNSASKTYNIKKHMLHSSKSDDKSHAMRENFFFRLFSDNYKPHKSRSVIKKRRDTNGIRKLDSSNSTMNQSILPHSVIPFSHFGRDRKINDDKICKTQIIKFFPKQIRKSFDNKNEFGNGSHRQITFNDNNNEWELRQDIFVEEILPFREKNDFGFKDVFHDEAKTIFDDILSIFTMLPFFDTVYVKLSTTERPKLSISRDNAEKSNIDDTNYFENLRKKRQAKTNETSETNETVSNNSEVHAKDSLKTDNSNTTFSNSTPELEAVNVKSSESTEIKKIDSNTVSDTTNSKPGKTEELTPYKAISFISVNHTNNQTNQSNTEPDKKSLLETAVNHDLNNSSSILLAVTSTVAELSKEKQLNPKDPVELQENDIEQYDIPLNSEEQDSINEKSTLLMVLGVIPGLIGLFIAIGVVGIWMIQKNSTLTERSNLGNEPTTSTQGKPATTLPCNI